MIFTNEQIIDDAFNYWRNKGFPYRQMEMFEIMQELNKLSLMPDNKCLTTLLGYRVADSFHNHRFESAANGMRSPVESFNNDNSLRKALELTLRFNDKIDNVNCTHTLMLVNGTQACANFRPGMAKYFMNKCGKKDGVFLDPCTGYGGRLIGFLCSNMKKYIGIDPNKQTYEANKEIDKQLNSFIGKEIDLYMLPFEDTEFESDVADFIFTSPPYFCKEIYSKDDTQSCNRYKKYESWRDNFLNVMMRNCYKYLKNERFCIINIEDVSINKKWFPLVDDTIKYGIEHGLRFIEKKLLKFNTPRLGVGKDSKDHNEKERKWTEESVLIFYKGNDYSKKMPKNDTRSTVDLSELF